MFGSSQFSTFITLEPISTCILIEIKTMHTTHISFYIIQSPLADVQLQLNNNQVTYEKEYFGAPQSLRGWVPYTGIYF